SAGCVLMVMVPGSPALVSTCPRHQPGRHQPGRYQSASPGARGSTLRASVGRASSALATHWPRTGHALLAELARRLEEAVAAQCAQTRRVALLRTALYMVAALARIPVKQVARLRATS